MYSAFQFALASTNIPAFLFAMQIENLPLMMLSIAAFTFCATLGALGLK